jgi:glycosyltransferase involved in cell wall biosynthesis
MGPSSYNVHHFGPDPAFVGGIGSVMRVLAENSIGGDHVMVHPTWVAGSPLGTVKRASRAAGAIAFRMGDRDIAHVHLSFKGSFVREGALLALARRRGLATVATIHGSSFLAFARRNERLVHDVLRNAGVTTCLDSDVLEFLRGLNPQGLTEFLPNPVAMDEPESSAAETDEVVLFAGEVGRRKGADVLQRAWVEVARRRPSARCVMLGPAGDFAVPETDRLDVRGPVDAGTVREFLRSARVVALPSRAEAMPMVLTEAMSCGRPFVSTPVGGIAELAREGGVLVPVGDPEGLADRLEDFLADPVHAREIGERGRRYCLETRSAAVVDARLRDLYAASLQRRRGAVG